MVDYMRVKYYGISEDAPVLGEIRDLLHEVASR